MSGVKGQQGGGGLRKDAGRPRRNLQLGKEAARTLAILTRAKRALLNNPALREEDVIARLIQDEWQELDAQYQEVSE
jgi:hypothetical protein